MSDVKIGELIDALAIDKAERDAVHIAVCPVIATETLLPGERIKFALGTSSARLSRIGEPDDGIVDPFLPHQVARGQCFWMFMWPGSTKALRHAWTHPAFEEEPEEPPEEPIVFEGWQLRAAVDDDDFCIRDGC
jgi:hypothetical protein